MATNKDINLLPYEERVQEKFESLQKKLSMASVGFLVLAIIFTMVTLVFYTALATQRSSLNKRISESSQRINTYKATEELIYVIKNKVSAADKILTSRTDYPKLFTNFSQLIPEGVYFTQIKIAKNQLSASGKAKSSSEISNLVSAFLDENGKKIISSVNVDSLSLGENSVYSFSITAQLK